MRLMLVTGSYPPEHCGVGDYSQQLAFALAEYTDLKVGVLTGKCSGHRVPASVELCEVETNWKFADISRLVKAIRSWAPDLLHIQYPSQAYSGRMASLLPLICRFLGLRVVQTWHEPYNLKQSSLFLLQLLGASGLIFVRPNYSALMPRVFRQLLRARPQVFIPNASSVPVRSIDPEQRQNLRRSYLGAFKRLVVFFGFIYPSKGIEALFEIANPSTDMLVIAGGIKDSAYKCQLAQQAADKGWHEDQILFTGFLASDEAATLLGAADAVVLPFLNGGGEWNTSIHGALAQGTLVITTSVVPCGDDPRRNLYTAAPSAIDEMKDALDRLAGRRVPPTSVDESWKSIAAAHWAFYRHDRILGSKRL